MRKNKLKTTLEAPALPAHLPPEAQWLSGEGAGSWFHIEAGHTHYRIERYSPEGRLECTGAFEVKRGKLDLKQEYQFIHLSHCASVTIRQGAELIELLRAGD